MADLFASLPASRAPLPGRHGDATGPAGVAVRRLDRAVATVAARPGHGAAVATRLSSAFGLPIRDASAVAADDVHALVGIAPGRWTAIGAADPILFAATLSSAVGEHAMVVDQSGGQVVLSLGGSALAPFLAKLVAIDLDPTTTPADLAVTTTIAHVGVTLWRQGADEVRLLVGRSLLTSMLRTLAAAAAEFGCDLDA